MIVTIARRASLLEKESMPATAIVTIARRASLLEKGPTMGQKNKGASLYVYVGTCGIGRQRFRAWLAGDRMDRQDGDDDDTHDTPGDAIQAVASRLYGMAFDGTLQSRLGKKVPRRDKDILEIVVTDGGKREIEEMRFQARFSDDDEPREHRPRGGGSSPPVALAEMAHQLNVSLVSKGWHYANDC